jgi:hypothetical protein
MTTTTTVFLVYMILGLLMSLAVVQFSQNRRKRAPTLAEAIAIAILWVPLLALAIYAVLKGRGR